MSAYCCEQETCCGNCIYSKLSALEPGTIIKLYYYGGEMTITFLGLQCGCITGEIMRTPIYISYDKVIAFSILPKIEWIPLAPEESYTLSSSPIIIYTLTFETKAELDTTSTVSIFIEPELILTTRDINAIPKLQCFSFNPPQPALLPSLKNTGSAPIYIRNICLE